MESPLNKDEPGDREESTAMGPNHVLGDDAFQNETTQRLFNAIDELKSCGASRDITDLPEIVIVGDQSVGKSSLLQSLTDIPFAVAGKLCTRFPTRIVSKRNVTERTTVSIEPRFSFMPGMVENTEQSEARKARQERYKDFEKSYSTFTAEDFSSVVEKKASQYMQISEPTLLKTQPASEPLHNFSEDILKVEIQGPKRSHFAILDLPGNFQSLTGALVEHDMRLVRRMVLEHIKNNQSIIVCVASGPTDLANQGVFDMASERDPEGRRTVGVITKCDVTQEPAEIVDVVRNETKPLHHGWFVVRNRSPTEVKNGVSSQEHHQKEDDFFRSEPWDQIPEERRGTVALRKYLSTRLCAKYQAVFPAIQKEVQIKKSETESALSAMGATRGTLSEKRVYLSDIASAFNSLIHQSHLGQYGSLSEDTMKLRMNVREANDTFASIIKHTGHAVSFVDLADSPIDGRGPDSGSTIAPARHIDFGVPKIKEDNGASDKPEKFNVGLFCPKAKHDFVPYVQQYSSGASDCFQSIGFREPDRNLSFEEVRLNDYMQDPATSLFPSAKSPFSFKPKTSAATSGFGSFSSSPSSAVSSNTTTDHETGPLFGPFGLPIKHQLSNSGAPFGSKSSTAPSTAEIYNWIRHEIKASRGTELQGTLNPSVLPILFHKQAQKWRGLAEAHFTNVIRLANVAVTQILELVCTDDYTRQKIQASIQANNRKQQNSCSHSLTEHVNNILSKHLQTNHEAFEFKVKEARMRRFQAALRRYARSNADRSNPSRSVLDSATNETSDTFLVNVRSAEALFAEIHMSNQQNLEDEIHDILRAYYEIARENFIEFVNFHIVERYLRDKEGPVFAFSPAYLVKMTDGQVESMAAEDEEKEKRRRDLEATLERLAKAEEIADRCMRTRIK